MLTVSSKISERELEAITEYANACDETVSNMIRKVVVGEAIFIKWANDTKEYEHGIQVPHNVLGEEETQIVQGTYNKIRKILRLNEIEI